MKKKRRGQRGQPVVARSEGLYRGTSKVWYAGSRGTVFFSKKGGVLVRNGKGKVRTYLPGK